MAALTGIPPWLYRAMGRTVTIEALVGTGAYGDTYADPVELTAIVDGTRRMVRDQTGEQVISETTIYVPIGTTVPPGSRVTVDGHTVTALSIKAADGGALPVPSHLEVALT